MSNQSIKRILLFILAILFQVMVLNNIQFMGFINPYYYPVVILLLSPSINQHWALLLAFFTGLIIDRFENTGALHASASLFMAYLRPAFLRLVSTQSGQEFDRLGISSLGLRNFLIYIGFGVFVHHFVLFTLDSLRLGELDVILWRTIRTSLLSIMVITFIQAYFVPTKKMS